MACRAKLILVMILLFVASACGDKPVRTASKTGNFDQFGQGAGQLAIVRTASSDFSSGSTTVIPINDLSKSVQGLMSGTSDFFLYCDGENLYKLDSFNLDRISRYPMSRPGELRDQWSILNGRRSSLVAHQILFSRSDKAYLVASNLQGLEVINPLTTDPAQRFLGTIDLSTYADGDGFSEIGPGVRIGNLLAIVHQRLNRNHPSGIWSPDHVNYLSIIDMNQDVELDLNKDADFFGIPLSVRNVVSRPAQHGSLIAVAGAGNLATLDGTFAGIEVLQMPDFNSISVFAKGRQFKKIVFDQNGRLWGIRYIGSNTLSLEIYNPLTGEQIPLFGNLNQVMFQPLTDIEIDKEGNLWVAEGHPRNLLHRFSTTTGQNLNSTISLQQSPQEIKFCP